jgi:HEAT repeat protein
MLDADIVMPKDAKDAAKVDEFKDQQFWQTTSALLLGELRDATAVEPLMKVFFDPGKADVHATAVLALVKIGRPALDAAIKVLKEEDKKMIEYALIREQKATGAKEPSKDKPYVQRAAILIGTIGRSEGAQALIDAARAADKEVPRAILARELAKLPSTAETKAAFKAAFEATPVSANIPPGLNGLAMLTESALMFYDPGMIDWLLERAEKTKGGEDELKGFQANVTVACIKLMKPDHVDRVKKAVDGYGTDMEKDLFKKAADLLKACGDRVACYLDTIEKSENQEQKTQFIAIKAGYMIGILGNDATRDELIARLESIENAGVRYTASQAIDHLSPKGSVEAADALKKIIDANARSADRNKAMGDSALKQVMYRIRTRASN